MSILLLSLYASTTLYLFISQNALYLLLPYLVINFQILLFIIWLLKIDDVRLTIFISFLSPSLSSYFVWDTKLHLLQFFFFSLFFDQLSFLLQSYILFQIAFLYFMMLLGKHFISFLFHLLFKLWFLQFHFLWKKLLSLNHLSSLCFLCIQGLFVLLIDFCKLLIYWLYFRHQHLGFHCSHTYYDS